MDHEVKLYGRYKRKITFLLISIGAWPDYRDHPRWFKIFINALGSCASWGVFAGILNFCLAHISNMGILTRGLGLMVSYFTASFKSSVLAVQHKKIASLNRGLSARFEEDLKDPENRTYLLHHFPTFLKFFKFLDFTTGLNILMQVLLPLLQVRRGKYVRSVPVLLPFEYESGGVAHWCLYAWELFIGYFCYCAVVGQDSLFGMYAMQLVGEFRLLAARFEALGNGLANEIGYRRQLKDCVDRHVLLIESHHLMESVFGFLSVLLAITCAIVLCSIIYQISAMEYLTVYRALYLVCYCAVKLSQAYSYGWYGNIVNTESERCLDSIYNSKWVGEGDLRMMNDVLIVESQNSLRFNAISFMIVRLDMFSKIVQTSMSYFFLLQTLESKTA